MTYLYCKYWTEVIYTQNIYLDYLADYDILPYFYAKYLWKKSRYCNMHASLFSEFFSIRSQPFLYEHRDMSLVWYQDEYDYFEHWTMLLQNVAQHNVNVT